MAMGAYDPVWSRARLLPSGQTVVSLGGELSVQDAHFNRYGEQENLGSGLTQKFRFQDALPEDLRQSLEVQNYLLERGLTTQSVLSITEFKVERRDLKNEWRWSHGLTPQWMIGLRVPFLKSEAKIHEKRTYTEAYSKATKTGETSNETELEMARTVEKNTGELFSRAMSNNDWTDYDSMVEYEGLGDVELLSQWGVLQTHEHAFSLRQRLTVPTSQAPDPYKFIQLSSADGQMDLGVDTLFDWEPSRRWVFTALVGYTLQLPDTVSARVPNAFGNRAQGEVDQNVDRNLGDFATTQFLSQYRLYPGIWLTGSYTFEVKERDSYGGDEALPLQYEFMEEDSSHEYHMGHLGLRYVVKDSYWRQGRGQKMAANINVYSVLAGKNYPASRSAALDIELYF